MLNSLENSLWNLLYGIPYIYLINTLKLCYVYLLVFNFKPFWNTCLSKQLCSFKKKLFLIDMRISLENAKRTIYKDIS